MDKLSITINRIIDQFCQSQNYLILNHELVKF
jgi:hypothetical protein